jgi:hypothetical protein
VAELAVRYAAGKTHGIVPTVEVCLSRMLDNAKSIALYESHATVGRTRRW